MAQIQGSELEVGQIFLTIDGLGGRVTSIVSHPKGWRDVTVVDPGDGSSLPNVYLFSAETLDVSDDRT